MKRGPYGKNKRLLEIHKSEIVRLRKEFGLGYGTIARQLDIPVHIVRYCVGGVKVDLNESVSKGLKFLYKDIPFEQIKTKHHKRKFLIQERGHKCEGCNLTHWRGEIITLELHNHTKPKADALLLCPNCHSQTDDWRGRKVNIPL